MPLLAADVRQLPIGVFDSGIGGLTVAALIIPKNLGYAAIAGVPLQNGLYAAAAGYTDVAKALVDHGADVNAKDVDGVTPAEAAIAIGTGRIVRSP